MVCVVPLGHELAELTSVTIADIARFPLIAHDPGTPPGQLLAAAFRRADLELASLVSIHETDVACALVRAGAGIAVADEFTVEGLDWSDVRAVPLADEIRLTPSIVRSVLQARHARADRFVEVMKGQRGGDGKRGLSNNTAGGRQ